MEEIALALRAKLWLSPNPLRLLSKL